MALPRRKAGAIGKLFYVLREDAIQLAGMGILFFATSVLDLVGIGLIGPFIGTVVNGTDLLQYATVRWIRELLGGIDAKWILVIFGAGLAAFYLAKGFAAFFVQRKILGFAFSFRAQLIRKLTESYLWMPYRFYLERNSAGIIRSITHDTKVMVDDLLIPALKLVSDGTVVILVLAFLAWINWAVVLLASCILGGVFTVYATLVRPRVRHAGEAVSVAHDDLIRSTQQAFNGIKEIRALAVESVFFGAVSRGAEHTARAQTAFNVMLAIPRYLMESVIVLVIIVLALFVVLQDEDRGTLVPLLAMFAVAGLRILPAAVQTSASIASMNYSTYALNAVYEDIRLFEEKGLAVPSCETREHLPRRFGRLTLEDVRFRYGSAPVDALYGINLSIHRGQAIGLIGPSGAGKTTLVDVLLGFHPITSGRVRIDGVDADSYGWNEWRRHIAYIPQNPILLDDTIEANIVFGAERTEQNRIKLLRAVEGAQLSRFVASLPDGLCTVIGERGVRLSGGERQRIALARGLFYDRDVFILDEATSALDNETERQVIDVLERFRGDKALIVIAHRLTTVRSCDVVYRMDRGRIVQAGPYEQVVGNASVA